MIAVNLKITFSKYAIMDYPFLLNPLLWFCWKQDTVDFDGSKQGFFLAVRRIFLLFTIVCSSWVFGDGLNPVDHLHVLTYLAGKEV